MKTRIILLLLIIVSCSQTEETPELKNQFTVNGTVYPIEGLYNYCGYEYRNGLKLYSSALFISDIDLGDVPSDLWEDISKGSYNIPGANIIIIQRTIGYMQNTLEIEEATKLMVETFSANNVTIGTNFNAGSYELFDPLTSVSNSSNTEKYYHIEFTGQTSNNKQIRCYFKGGIGTKVIKLREIIP